jgi:hypothetical protein
MEIERGDHRHRGPDRCAHHLEHGGVGIVVAGRGRGAVLGEIDRIQRQRRPLRPEGRRAAHVANGDRVDHQRRDQDHHRSSQVVDGALGGGPRPRRVLRSNACSSHGLWFAGEGRFWDGRRRFRRREIGTRAMTIGRRTLGAGLAGGAALTAMAGAAQAQNVQLRYSNASNDQNTANVVAVRLFKRMLRPLGEKSVSEIYGAGAYASISKA